MVHPQRTPAAPFCTHSIHTDSFSTDSSDKAGTPWDEEEIRNFDNRFYAPSCAYYDRPGKDNKLPLKKNLFPLPETLLEIKSEARGPSWENWDELHRPDSSVSFEEGLEDCMSENSVYNKPKKIKRSRIFATGHSSERDLNPEGWSYAESAVPDCGLPASFNFVNLILKGKCSAGGFCDRLQEGSDSNEEVEGSVCDENDLDEREMEVGQPLFPRRAPQHSFGAPGTQEELKLCDKVPGTDPKLSVLSKGKFKRYGTGFD